MIVDTEASSPRRTLRLTGGEGVHVVFDGSGPDHFFRVAGLAAPLGYILLVRPGAGRPGPLDIMSLPKSIKLGYAVFLDHIHTPELLRRALGATVRLACRKAS